MKTGLILFTLYAISVIVARYMIRKELDRERLKPDLGFALFALIPVGNLAIALRIALENIIRNLNTTGKVNNLAEKFFGMNKEEKGDK